ncbi:glycosyltransferase family 4 protein [Lutimaribacter marinistellae]|uniref:Glycosyltransferase family 4 protein n=1 Tax=Lutimaribacter marinistellae TaxID=1820329 RepID=A0ABV7TCV2_9RHOB
MPRMKIVHLVDDTTAGGVMRMLERLMELDEINAHAEQSVRRVGRGAAVIGSLDADVIVSHLTVSWRGLAGLIGLRAMNPSARLIHIEHSYTRAFAALNVARKARFFALLRVAYSLFDTVVAVSRAQASWLIERQLVDRDALRVVHPEVDLEPFALLSPPADVPRTIGAIGRLDRQKGFDVLIEAFRLCKHADARLLIFGEGDERDNLETLAAGDSRIEFRGHAESPADAYGEVDIVALPSRWEAYGLVAREAAASGRRTMLSPVDGLTDQISEDSFVVTQYEPAAWAATLERAFAGEAPTHWVSAVQGCRLVSLNRWPEVLLVDGASAQTVAA